MVDIKQVPYELSTKYGRLHQLLLAGFQIVCFADYDARSGNPCRDICIGKWDEDSGFRFAARGSAYIGSYQRNEHGYEKLSLLCEEGETEDIVPK